MLSFHAHRFSSNSPTSPRPGCSTENTFKLEADSYFGGMDYTSKTPLSLRVSGVSHQQSSPSYSDAPSFEETIVKNRSRSQSNSSTNSRNTKNGEERELFEGKSGYMQSPVGFSPSCKMAPHGIFTSCPTTPTFDKNSGEVDNDNIDNSSVAKKRMESVSEGTEKDDTSEYTVYSHLAAPRGNAMPTFNGNYHSQLCLPPLGVGTRRMDAGCLGGSSGHLTGGGRGDNVTRAMSIGELVHNRLQAQSPVEGLEDYSTYV